MCIFMEEGTNTLSLEDFNDIFRCITTERRKTKCGISKEKPTCKDENQIE